jgi:hypothetical protein
MSMWGLLSALYVDPAATKRIDASFRMLLEFLLGLRAPGAAK